MLKKIWRKITYPPYRPALLMLIGAIMLMMPAVAFASDVVQIDPEGSELHTMLVFGLTGIFGLIGTGLTQLLKVKLNLQEKAALLLTYGIALVTAIVELLVLGWFVEDMLTIDNLPALFSAVFTWATFWYGFYVKGQAAKAKG